MASGNYKSTIQDLLSHADVKINGDRPWDIQVHNENLYPRILSKGSLGLGEAYMDGWWDCESLDQFFFRIQMSGIENKVKPLSLALPYLKAKIFNYQRKSKAFNIGEKHYDIGNDLYTRMLGKTMAYTCGYWKHAENLEQAQEAKLDLVCRKIGLKPGMKILDIGCGWGSLMKYAAEKYGIGAVGVTVSKEQVELGRKLCEGLPIEFQLKDYRDIEGKFDRIVSLGMIEHVGYKNYKKMFEVANKHLTDGGLFLLHTIGWYESVTATDPWLAKYIFPGGMLPSIKQLSTAAERLFIVEDLHNFGAYYDKTLMAWFENFNSAWPELKKNYNERFYRMWKYYHLSCAATFRARKAQLWQFVFSKNGVLGGYDSVR